MRSTSFLLIFAALAAAQPNPIETAFPVLDPSSWTSGEPEAAGDVAMNRSGDGVVVWRTRTTTTPVSAYEIWAQPLRRGSLLGVPLLMATPTDGFTGAGELLRVRCAIDDFGNWVVVWDGDAASGFNLVCRARRFHGATQTLGPVVLVTDGAGGQHRVLPDVALGRYPTETASSFWVVWQDGVAAGQTRIRMRRFRIDAGGATPIDVPQPILDVNSEATLPTQGQDRPAIGVATDATVTVLWQKFAVWGPGSGYWRPMLRSRRGATWLPVFDPTSPAANPQGFDFTDYEVSSLGDPAAGSNPFSPPRVAVAPDGRVVAAWCRNSGAPFGFRIFTASSTAMTPGTVLAHLPTSWSVFHRRFDVAMTNEGSILLAWEALAALNISGQVRLNRIDANSGLSREEVSIDPIAGQALTSVAIGAAGTGRVHVAWSRGTGPAFQRIHVREADLNLLARSPTSGTTLDLWIPGGANFTYVLWPLASSGGPYAQTPIGDGRAADFSLTDPLLQWHLAQGPNPPVLPAAIGNVLQDGTASLPVVLPPAVLPLTLSFVVAIVDPAQPGATSLRSFTQPEALIIN